MLLTDLDEIPDEVAAVYRAAVADFDGDELKLHSGPGHIVFSDDNLDDANIDFCIEACDDIGRYRGSFSKDELRRIKGWLLKLKEIPESIRWGDPS